MSISYDEGNDTLSFEKDGEKLVLVKGKDDIESIFKKELETAVIAPDLDNDGNKIEQKEVVEEDEIIDDSEFDFDSMYEDYEILFEDED